jgi:hypothetical protein
VSDSGKIERKDGPAKPKSAQSDLCPQAQTSEDPHWEELRYRATGGQQGTAPLQRIMAARANVGASVLQRLAIMRKIGAAAEVGSTPAVPEAEERDANAEGAQVPHGGDVGAIKQRTGPISAKLDAIKIHLAPKDKNPAGPATNDPVATAALDRMTKSGATREVLETALREIIAQKPITLAAMEEFQQSWPDAKTNKNDAMLVRDAKRSCRSAVNSVTDHLSDADLTGAMRDVRKDPVPNPIKGGFFDHAREVRLTIDSLANARRALECLVVGKIAQGFDKPTLDQQVRGATGAIQRLINLVEKALKNAAR